MNPNNQMSKTVLCLGKKLRQLRIPFPGRKHPKPVILNLATCETKYLADHQGCRIWPLALPVAAPSAVTRMGPPTKGCA